MTVPVGTTGRNPEVDYPRESLLKGKERKRKHMPKWGDEVSRRMRARAASPAAETPVDYFDGLPDDLVVCVLFKLSSSAASPSDFMCAALTCKRFKKLAFHPLVLLRGSMKMFAIRAKNWSDSAHRFLKQCIDAGNLDACYTLGMIRFYCLQNRDRGASLMAKAAIGSHAAALYSLAVIQFNGSGGSKNDKDLKAGVALCARAAYLGHVDALRELGHCLQDGYGVRQNIADGRKFLVQANARELAAVLSTSGGGSPWLSLHRTLAAAAPGISVGCPLLSDFGCSVPAPEPHPVNSFLVDWFNARGGIEGGGEGLRICSHPGCGRPETRRHEFRRCSICGKVNYCSRACQALDWKLVHKAECAPVDQWVVDAVAPPENDGSGDEMD